MKFELVQPGEFDEYYYRVWDDNTVYCCIEYSKDNVWILCSLINDIGITSTGLSKILIKINELNAATKADKLFGFL